MWNRLQTTVAALLSPELGIHHRRVRNGQQAIYLEYPAKCEERYGPARGGHPKIQSLLQSFEPNYQSLIEEFGKLKQQMRNIPANQPTDPKRPYWLNGWVQGLDTISLYSIPAIYQSNLYIEIGSGNSTKFVRQAVNDGVSRARIVSIDPMPRAEIDDICDESIRQPVESVDLTVFDRLNANDVLMIDNSHRCFQNSDVTVAFLDILPRLKKGVLVYIDDIYLPYDYPESWRERYYSEQYLLATMLLADQGKRYEVMLPSWYCYLSDHLRASVGNLMADVGHPPLSNDHGNGFWLRVIS